MAELDQSLFDRLTANCLSGLSFLNQFPDLGADAEHLKDASTAAVAGHVALGASLRAIERLALAGIQPLLHLVEGVFCIADVKRSLALRAKRAHEPLSDDTQERAG